MLIRNTRLKAEQIAVCTVFSLGCTAKSKCLWNLNRKIDPRRVIKCVYCEQISVSRINIYLYVRIFVHVHMYEYTSSSWCDAVTKSHLTTEYRYRSLVNTFILFSVRKCQKPGSCGQHRSFLLLILRHECPPTDNFDWLRFHRFYLFPAGKCWNVPWKAAKTVPFLQLSANHEKADCT